MKECHCFSLFRFAHSRTYTHAADLYRRPGAPW